MSLDINYSGGVFSAPQAKSVGTVTAGTEMYNLAVASYDGVSFSVTNEEDLPRGIFFKTDGTKFYVVGLSGDDINEYDLSTAWDISTASINQTFDFSTNTTNPWGLFINEDGTKLFVIDNPNDSVDSYDFGTAWDISTLSYDTTFSVNSQATNPYGLAFKPDGTKMYVSNYNTGIYEYNLSTGFDLSTASYNQFGAKDSSTAQISGISFSPNGDKAWVVDYGNDDIDEYDLSTAWDISTLSYSRSFSVASQDTLPNYVIFKTDGSKMYVMGSATDTIYQYSTGTATTLDLSTGNYFSHTPSVNTLFAFSNPPASGTAAGFALALTGANVAETYDIANASYDSVSFSVATEETSATGMFFKPDGTKMYVVGLDGDDVNEYNLSTAWDITTASYNQNFSVATQDTLPVGISFKPDGTKMYIAGNSSDAIHEYSLSTAWDVSTASYSQSFSVSAQDTQTSDVFFKPDGTVMFVTATSGDEVNMYTLSTAWDISTASYTSRAAVGSQDIFPSGLSFNSDGTKMFVIGSGNDSVYEYSLSTAWTVSATYQRSFSVASQTTGPSSMFFKSDGSKMYVLDGSGVYQYSTQATSTATFTYPSSVKFPSGIAPAGPAIDETDVLVFYTDDGGTTYQGFRAGNAMA